MLLAGQELALGPTARGIDERTKGALDEGCRAPPNSPARPRRHRNPGPGGHRAASCLLHRYRQAPAKELDRLLLGGFAFAQISARKGESATIIAEPADLGEASAEVFAADLALGAVLRSYTFKKYRHPQG